MIIEQNLPTELNQLLAAESKDFAVKSSRAYPRRTAYFFLAFAGFWLVFTSIFFIGFFGPLITTGETHFVSNDVPTTASWDNLSPLLMPALFILVFAVVGLSLLAAGVYRLFKTGGYFIGTPQRLVVYSKNSIRSIDWEQFSGDIQLSGNNHQGNLTLVMRTGRAVSRKDGGSDYVPDTVYMAKIPDVFEIERICRKRIKENDPTPTKS